MLDVDRRQVLAYRIAAHGLHREAGDATSLAVFDLGVQDVTQRGTAELAVAARLSPDAAGTWRAGDDRFVLAWSHRGAPHYHRADEFRALIPALVPLDDTDAQARLSWQRKEITAAGMPATEVIRTAAHALREAVGTTMTKGAASTAVTKLVPAGLTRPCRPCQATHIHEQLMRLATPLAGILLEAGTSPATLTPLDQQPDIPETTDIPAATRVVEHYLRLHGPATPAEAARFVGTTRATVEQSFWPADLAEIRVDGQVRHLPADRVAALENPPEPDPVRLLPPWDPFLQARDRTLLVPEAAHQKEVWKVLGNPGALLAGGEITGTWRARTAGRRLEITLTALLPMAARDRIAAEEEARRVATVRGATDVRVTWS